ncbi:tRNA lysidine(34) synthetase TilS [Sphingobacterium sp. 1.A.5]|uniref:tRNA lysidine(34) synthetase TilS n=1 Tax=Sphingobacterium sp. 1.A.5 TaxID=2044604 RepID=UPI000C0BC832|nr:tRNA lysidine(34) synthetase TilS [Sphingobacterium sp. 1.A.5]
MSIQERLKHYIENKQLFAKENKVLLAVSGGKDSMLMARLLHDMEQSCIIAHCNFQLRGQESDKDEELVRQYASELGFPVFVKRFETETFATINKVSIQMAARELRYDWFEELRSNQHCDVIAIAQHANDHLETMLLNLTRSTGIQGLTGIQPRRGKLIRPLLFLNSEEIAKEVAKLNVPYRDDQSNFSTKYARNKIRLEIIPKFKEIQPDFESILEQNIQHFNESHQFIKKQVDAIRKSLFLEDEGTVKINVDSIKPYIEDHYLLFELFKPYQFQRNVLEDLSSVIDNPMGQVFESDTHKLLLDRSYLILQEKGKNEFTEITIDNINTVVNLGSKSFSMNEEKNAELKPDKFSAKVDFDKLAFPLVLRPWKIGDSFKPLGMEGSKKISDFFIQHKLNRFEKDAVPILVNANDEVIWIVGMRLDNRYKVTENTKKVLTLVYK